MKNEIGDDKDISTQEYQWDFSVTTALNVSLILIYIV